MGGDYDGNGPTTAEGAMSYLKAGFNEYFRDRITCFIPFLQKVVDGEDFSLADLALETRSVRLIKGRWPW